jgi:ABC-type molybdate transport system substrate-binding protein
MRQKSRSLILLVFLLCVAVAIVADVVIQARSKMVLQGFFTNDDYNLFPAEKIQDAYQQTLFLKRNEKINFEDSLYIEVGSHKDYTTASASKVIAYTAAKELDFMVTTGPLVDHYSTGMALEDLRGLTDPSLSKYLVMGKDGNHQEKAIAIDMTESRFVHGTHKETPYYLIVPENSKRKEAVRSFIAWAFSR